MVTVLFGSIDSYTDLGLFLTEFKRANPTPKRTLAKVPCRDGNLDLTYALSSEIHYENRELVLTFKAVDYSNDWETVFSNISSQLHGKKMHVVFSNDPDWYWDCFVTVDPESEYNVGTVEVICDAYPYKRKDYYGSVSATSSGVPLAIQVTMQTVVPTITCANAITVKPDSGATYSLAAGTHIDPGFKLTAGVHSLLIKGSGLVTVSFINGRL